MTTANHYVKFSSGRKTKKSNIEKSDEASPTIRIPRITKMMALAIRFEHLIKTGQVKDQAELARLGDVSRARLSQIMDLLLLAPDIQEAILFATDESIGMHEKTIQPISRLHSWKSQRKARNKCQLGFQTCFLSE
jgi:hypothetical protein